MVSNSDKLVVGINSSEKIMLPNVLLLVAFSLMNHLSVPLSDYDCTVWFGDCVAI